MKTIITATLVTAFALLPTRGEAQMFFGGGNNNGYVSQPSNQSFSTVTPSYNRFRIVTPRGSQFQRVTPSGIPLRTFPAPVNYYDTGFYGNNYNYAPRYQNPYQWYWR